MKYVLKLTLPESPSISGSFNAIKKKKKIMPERMNNTLAIHKVVLKGFIVYKLVSLWKNHSVVNIYFSFCNIIQLTLK